MDNFKLMLNDISTNSNKANIEMNLRNDSLTQLSGRFFKMIEEKNLLQNERILHS